MQDFEGIRQRARSIIGGGLTYIVHQVADHLRPDDDSDADDDKGLGEITSTDEQFIRNGVRGILIFCITSVKTGRSKTVHVNLYKMQVVVYSDPSTGPVIIRSYQCADISNIARIAEKVVQIELKGAKVKKFMFENEQITDRFHQYLEYINEQGLAIKRAFNAIDYTHSGKINLVDLIKALVYVDLNASIENTNKMIRFAKSGSEIIDYYSFFHLFMNSFVSNLRDCLQEWLTLATSEDDSTSAVSTQAIAAQVNIVPGEIMSFVPEERVHWCISVGKSIKSSYICPGRMFATNYRIVFISSRKPPNMQSGHSRYDVPSYLNTVSIPLATIHRLYYAPPRNSIFIVGKDYRVIRITLSGSQNNRSKVEVFVQLLHNLAFGSIREVFAYKYLPRLSTPDNPWNVSDIIKEYERLGFLDSKEWRIFENTDYQLSPTYPRYLVMPKAMSDEQIKGAAAFRSQGRLPVITYCHRQTDAILARSAQPLVGLTQKNSEDDKRLLELYRMKGRPEEPSSVRSTHSKMYILDARGKLAATLNMAAGKGTEDVSLYINTELVFGNIDNIHVMRNAANSFAENFSSNIHPHSGGKDILQSYEGSAEGYFTRMEQTGWLRYLRLILLSAVFAAEKLHFDGCSVLVHCSDGWDRTAQICSITQILLDPYYRTLEGLAALIEKEWCSFGHRFQDRCGHSQDHNNLPDERSPVFVQFLDCLYQLLLQFPLCFEYDERVLLFLADHSTSCLFGNFIGNNERERRQELGILELTHSIWGYVFERRAQFTYSNYSLYPAPIWPALAMHRMQVWERYWLRWDMLAHPNRFSGKSPWQDDWGDIDESGGSPLQTSTDPNPTTDNDNGTDRLAALENEDLSGASIVSV